MLMKNLKSVTSMAILSMFVVGCVSQNNPVQQQPKVDTVKVSEVNKIDLGYKNGATLSVNMKFGSQAQKFGIKAIHKGFFGTPSLNQVELRLHTAPGTGIANRWSAAPQAIAPKLFGNGTPGSVNANNNIKFSGLKPNTTYYLSARAYSDFVNPTAGSTTGLSVDAAGTTLTGTATTWNTNGPGKLMPGDRIRGTYGAAFDARVVSVTNDTTITVSPSIGTTGVTNPNWTVWKNVVAGAGAGTILGGAGGMLDNGTADLFTGGGGGTAPALFNAAGTNEENAALDAGGVLTVTNDMTPGGGATGSAPANQSLDMIIQLVKDVGASVDGTVAVRNGDVLAGATEAITP